jgi:ribosomal protein S25
MTIERMNVNLSVAGICTRYLYHAAVVRERQVHDRKPD